MSKHHKILTDDIVAQIRARARAGLKRGEHKVIANSLGMTRSYISQIIRGTRRKAP